MSYNSKIIQDIVSSPITPMSSCADCSRSCSYRCLGSCIDDGCGASCSQTCAKTCSNGSGMTTKKNLF